MGLRRKLGLRLLRLRFVRKAVEERADLAVFGHRPDLRLAIGLGLLAISMLLGWPAVGVLTGMAIYFDEPMIGLVGGPAIYGFSWILYLGGLWVAGKEVLRYAGAFNRWMARKGTEKLLGPEGPPWPVKEEPTGDAQGEAKS